MVLIIFFKFTFAIPFLAGRKKDDNVELFYIQFYWEGTVD